MDKMNNNSQELLESLIKNISNIVSHCNAYENIIPNNNTTAIMALSSLKELATHSLNEAQDIHQIMKNNSPKSEIPLSPRELETLCLVAKGLSNKEIAYQLQISDRTVQFHIKSIFSKTNTFSRTEAVVQGIKEGWISP